MLQFDLFVTVFYAAVRSASNSIRFCKKQLLSCLLAIYIGRGLEYFRGNFKFFKIYFFGNYFSNRKNIHLTVKGTGSLLIINSMSFNFT